MNYYFAELDCEQVRDILVVSRKKTAGNGVAEQRVFMNRDGVFRFDESMNGSVTPKVIRLPFVKVWVFCTMICDMLAVNAHVR